MTEVIRDKAALRALVGGWKQAGEVVGVVPTMGALHAGHLSLVEQAKASSDRVIVTIFVNPKQFNSSSDLDKYPRTEEADLAALAPFAVDAVYIPAPDQIYPDGFATKVTVAGLTSGLCGDYRPGHFDGVTTVVPKLFLQTGADRAFFGEKDYQQLMVVRRMATDLDIPIEVVGCETVREPDGLALSSRNVLLSDEARKVAPALSKVMQDMKAKLEAGATMQDLHTAADLSLIRAGFEKVEYLELRSAADLAPLTRADTPARLLAAAWLDGVRLIDNIAIGG